MTASTWILASAVIIGLLGAAHLLLTYRGAKLLPRDSGLRQAMQRTHPVITTQTTMWRAWIGFNASHSLGALLFAALYGYLSLAHAAFLLASWPLLLIGLVTLLAYALMAWRYWFITPRIGIGVALSCYLIGLLTNPF